MRLKNAIFYILSLCLIYLFYNRFFYNFTIEEKVLCNFPLRNVFEHLLWGFIPPILFVSLFLGLGILWDNKIKWKNSFFGLVIWFILFIAVEFFYYKDGISCKIILDIIGVVLAGIFLYSQLPD